jgi:hypothetical protein
VRRSLVAIGVLLWCTAARAEEPVVVLTAADEQALRKKIESNWNVGPVSSECPQAMVVRVYLEGDGTVKDVKLVDPQPLPDACQQAAESAKRATLISSPLTLPKGLNAFTIDIVFDHNKFREDATSSAPSP